MSLPIGSLLSTGPKFWNIRSSLLYGFGLVDIGTHMSIIQLNSGRFLVLDTIPLSPSTKADIDTLTNNGSLIEAVVATHPYHSLYFESFYQMYPSPKYYGTARHLRNITGVKWTGDITRDDNMKLWIDDGVEMRIPAGADFNNPVEDNHFAGIFVYHRPSRTIHLDDTLSYFNEVGFVMKMFGSKPKRLNFHPQIAKALCTKEAPLQFKSWLEDIVRDWDFDHIVTAHNGIIMGGAKEQLKGLIAFKTEFLEKLSQKNA
jgi:hypothetical protein